jgi:RNA 2',3'-cyclic 3'-phosphodiesterase
MAEHAAEPPEDPPQRLFLAIEIPSEVIDAVGAAVRPWRESFPTARWIPPENWHVTLKFLGRTAARLLPWVGETVGAIAAAHPPATLRVRGLGAFPSTQRARVLWAGIDDPAGVLTELVADLESGLAEAFRPEVRRFHPHLTVARSEPPLRLPEPYPGTVLESEAFVVDRVVLFRSHLHGRGSPTYEPLRTFALEG